MPAGAESACGFRSPFLPKEQHLNPKLGRMLLSEVPPMNSPAIPWNVLSSTVSVGVLTEGWTLADAGPAPEVEATRTFVVDVAFVSPFSSVPVVQLGLTGFDIDQRDSARIGLKTDNITEYGFQVILSTWAGTRVYGADFHWFAI